MRDDDDDDDDDDDGKKKEMSISTTRNRLGYTLEVSGQGPCSQSFTSNSIRYQTT
jgi:hypothetical protein